MEAEYEKKISAAKSIEAVGAGGFGEVVSESTGRTEFVSVDIDIPGNSGLPVRLGRRLPMDTRYISEELGGIGNWDMDVPYIEATFSKLLGWSVAASNSPNRYKRCSISTPPLVEGTVFSSEEVSHGYQIHVPGVLDGVLLRETDAIPDPTDGLIYPWILNSYASVSCLATLKNGYPGEGFLLKLTDGTKYYFDYPVERIVPTLRKASKNVPGYSVERRRLFLLATRIEDGFGNYVNYQYSGDRLTGITSNDGRQITLVHGANSITASTSGRTWTYALQNGHLTTVTNPDGSNWTYEAFGNIGGRIDFQGDALSIEGFLPENFCLNASLDNSPYAGGFQYSVKHPSGATALFTFHGKQFYRSYVPYLCAIDFFDHHVKIFSAINAISEGGDWAHVIGDLSEYQNPMDPAGTVSVSGVAHIMQPNHFGVFALVSQSITGPGLSPVVTSYNYQIEGYPYCDQFSSVTGEIEGVRCNEDPCPAAACSDSVGRWVEVVRPSGDKVRRRYGVIYGENENLLLEEEIVSAAGQTLSSTVHTYYDGTNLASPPFAGRFGWPHTVDPTEGVQRPRISTEIRQQGVLFRNVVENFDAFARPIRVTRSSSPAP